MGNQQDIGADPAFVASQSSPQAVSTKGFNPGEVFAIIRSTGEYSDRCETVVGYVLTEENAQAAVTLACREIRGALEVLPRPKYPADNEDWGALYSRYERAMKR